MVPRSERRGLVYVEFGGREGPAGLGGATSPRRRVPGWGTNEVPPAPVYRPRTSKQSNDETRMGRCLVLCGRHVSAAPHSAAGRRRQQSKCWHHTGFAPYLSSAMHSELLGVACSYSTETPASWGSPTCRALVAPLPATERASATSQERQHIQAGTHPFHTRSKPGVCSAAC